MTTSHNVTIRSSLEMQNRPIKVLVVGCGGNGSNFIQSALYRIHTALIGLGHEHGIDAIFADGETVSETNTLRSAFFPQDVGINKAFLLASRMNLTGLNARFRSIQANLTPQDIGSLHSKESFDVIVGGVDDAQWRVGLHDHFHSDNFHSYIKKDLLWLDMGNDESTGQVVLSHLIKKEENCSHKLPTVVELFPNIRTVKTNKKRSCSAQESFSQQGVLVNQQCALLAGRLLNDYLTKQTLEHHGNIFDLNKGIMTPIKANTNNWLVYGYVAPELSNEKETDSQCA